MSRSFKPVFLPADRALDGRARQTFLRHYSMCPRSAFLSRLYEDDGSTAAMTRGTALHEVQRRAVAMLMEMGEATIPEDVAKTLTEEVLAELPVPFEEHDYLRECAWRWASEFACDPSAVVANETLFMLEMGGWQVTGRIDFAEVLENGAVVYVADTKSSKSPPPFEEIARKMSDGRLVPKQLQVVLYALLLAFGVPVREEECDDCEDGMVTHAVLDGGLTPPLSQVRGTFDGETYDAVCSGCGGSGVVETPEPFSVAPRARTFNLEFVYPGVEGRDGKMVRRPMTLGRLELEEYRASLAGLLARLDRSVETGDWPAVESDAACGECPAPGECPIPQELRDWRGRINTVEQASEAASVLDRQKAELRAAQTELRNFAKQHGPIVAGGKVWDVVYSESERIVDMDGLWAAVERTVRYGEPFDRTRFVRVQGKRDFKARDLTAEERNGDG